MASINISIKKEAYEFLKEIKTDKKSFSDAILSFKKGQNNILKYFGVLKDVDWDVKEQNMKKLRSSFKNRLG